MILNRRGSGQVKLAVIPYPTWPGRYAGYQKDGESRRVKDFIARNESVLGRGCYLATAQGVSPLMCGPRGSLPGSF